MSAMAVTAALGSLGSASAASPDLDSVRAATAGYHHISSATAAGYAELHDLAGIACIDEPGTGAMGIHYVRGEIVGDGSIDALTPRHWSTSPFPTAGSSWPLSSTSSARASAPICSTREARAANDARPRPTMAAVVVPMAGAATVPFGG